MSLPPEAPIATIGGGIIGCSTLHRLALKEVPALLAKHRQIAFGATCHAAGIAGQPCARSAQAELAEYTGTACLFQKLVDETGQAAGCKQNGAANLAMPEVGMQRIGRSHDHAPRSDPAGGKMRS